MKRVFLGLFLCLLFAGSAYAANPLVGTWVSNILGNEVEVTYRSDGTFSERSGGVTASGTYSISGNRVTGVIPGLGTQISEFEAKGNELIFKPVYAEMKGQDITSTVRSMTFTYTRRDNGQPAMPK